jgi:hypothetical protein
VTCQTWDARGLPGPLYQHSFISVNQHGLISDVNILNLQMVVDPHIDQFSVTLISPQQAFQIVMGYSCPNLVGSYRLHYDLDDEAAALVNPCNPNQHRGTFKPENPLSVFDGQDAFGRWGLFIDAPIPAFGDNPASANGSLPDQIRPSLMPLPLPMQVSQPGPTATPLPASRLESWSIEICFTNGQRMIVTSDGRQFMEEGRP